MRTHCTLTFALTLIGSTAGAQIQIPTPYNPVIAGVPVRCTAADGQPVAFVANPLLGDVGQAVPGLPPRIELNPGLLSQFPPALQLFWYGHECAHHALGHTVFFTVKNEAAADCWSIRTLKRQNLATRDDVLGFGPYFVNNPGSPWGHLPGPERIANFMACYGGSASREETRERKGSAVEKTSTCEAEYQSCLANVRSVGQCIEEEFPERCINTCMKSFGFSYRECASRRCLPTQSNLRGWRSRCASITEEEREECRGRRQACGGR